MMMGALARGRSPEHRIGRGTPAGRGQRTRAGAARTATSVPLAADAIAEQAEDDGPLHDACAQFYPYYLPTSTHEG
jgi:hypothetical protein